MNKGMQGILQPFPAPDKKWKVITMEFIFDIPRSEAHTGIWTLVYKLSNPAPFSKPTDKSKAPEIAHIFYKEK